MTQTYEDPWAAAAARHDDPMTNGDTPTSASQPAQGGQGALAGAFAGGGNRLFNAGSVAPSLFNKTHGVGTALTGIVTDIQDRQDVDFDSKAPKFFSRSKVNGKAVTTNPIDGPTGEKNEPVMTTHITLKTDYKMTPQECDAVNRSHDFIGQDDGTRVLVVGGKQPTKAFFDAIQVANGAGLGLTGYDSLKGKRIFAKRAGQEPIPGRANKSWVMEFVIRNA